LCSFLRNNVEMWWRKVEARNIEFMSEENS
jgi:hypothetical protein